MNKHETLDSSGIICRAIKDSEYSKFFDLMLAETSDYLSESLQALGMTHQEFEKAFRTTGTVYTICSGTQICGFFWLEFRRPVVHVHALVLFPEAQGRAIGLHTMRHIEKLAFREGSLIEIGVHESNRRALSLCLKLGYKVTSRLPTISFNILQKELS